MMDVMAVLAGFHPVREALRSGRTLERVVIARGAAGPRFQEIIDLAKAQKVPVRFEPRESLDRHSPKTPHQGVIALGATKSYATLEDILAASPAPRLIVLLDGIEDPHNVGAIIRTAHAAGADAIVIPERRAAPVTETVEKAAAGALAWLPVVRAVNLNRSLELLKEAGFWIYGIDERGTQSYTDTDFDAKTALVLGGEGHGLHQQLRQHCDFILRIPMAGEVSSLNVSVAAGVVLFELQRRARLRGTPEPA
jgi:23S rRNA (guanosine2251-2'-O)-methyltransferase